MIQYRLLQVLMDIAQITRVPLKGAERVKKPSTALGNGQLQQGTLLRSTTFRMRSKPLDESKKHLWHCSIVILIISDLILTHGVFTFTAAELAYGCSTLL